jgi:hypothetical protein
MQFTQRTAEGEKATNLSVAAPASGTGDSFIVPSKEPGTTKPIARNRAMG